MLRMETDRASSFLPTIKCSMCAKDIEISQMGDHVCGGASTAGDATPPPEAYGNFDRVPGKQTATNGPSFLKPGRALPPRVDTSAANRPFFPTEELTPVSASPPRSGYPLYPETRRTPLAKPLRSATAPLLRPTPSPDLLSSNLDCAFPPFPTSKPTKSKSLKPGGHGGTERKYAEPYPMYAPVSPRTASSGGLLQRMNTIAPGPFDIKKRQHPGEVTSDKGHKRQGTGGSVRDMTNASVDQSESVRRPSTAEPGHSRTNTNSSNGSQSGASPPQFPKKNGYGGFGPPSGDIAARPLLSPESRSQTFPLSSKSQGSSDRRPSDAAAGSRMQQPPTESGPRAINRSKSPAGTRNPSVSGPDLSRPLPPRGTSLIRPRVDARLGDSLPVPVNLAAEFGIGNPYHTPNDSSSSDASAYSDASKASSRSSPPRSIGPGHSRRQASDATQVDVLMADLESSMGDLKTKEPPKSSISPPRIKQQYPRPLHLPPKLGGSMLSPESPMDPTIQSGRLSPVPRNQARSLSPSRSQPQADPIRRPTTAGRQSGRPSTSKGNCKGCGEAIKGKSVSSADGRLTGRYHKHCFVCKTCQEPFQTATFYVINDAPYCERHYHKLNGSVCQACDKGIEGQYLESERKQKFHPGCLTCADCKRTLRNDYFEMNGRVYCERDAFQRTQQARRFLGPGAGGSNRMERRTTRLMMM